MQSSKDEQDTSTNTLVKKRSFQTMLNVSSDTKPYGHRTDVFKVAMKRNTIAYFDSGAGKAMVAVMIIKQFATYFQKQQHLSRNKLIVFLAPTSNLVEQQFNVIKENTDLAVDYYHETKVRNIDGRKVDLWDAAKWEHATSKSQVLVMTPQVLLDALRNAYIKFEMVWLLIIDECHHANGNHPYVSIMKEFYLKAFNKPKVFGMTASLVTKKAEECEAQLTTLESLLDSEVYTLQNWTERENTTPSPSHNYCFYQPAMVNRAEIKVKLESLKLKFEVQLLEMQISLRSSYKDTDKKHEMLRKRLSNECANVIYCIDELGLLCAYEALKICVAMASKAVEECDLFQQSCSKCLCFLEEALSIVGKYLPKGHENVFDAGCDYENMIAAGYISPKLNQLFQLFQSFGGATKVLCLIFVEKVITAKVLETIVKRVADLSHMEVSCLSVNSSSFDAMSPKQQKESLGSFRSKKVNLLFATNAVEEGIDVPKCSTVIYFDVPKTAHSNVQSLRRTRQSGSNFIILLERGNAKQRERVCDLIRCEQSMVKSIKKRDLSIWDSEDLSRNKSAKSNKEPSSGSGTSKRKELHGITPIRALSGTWGDKLDGDTHFFGYKVSFSCSISDAEYSNFVFLVETKLDDDVTGIEMDLFLLSKFVKCSVSSYVELHLNAQQISKSKCFQELFFNGIFGKLYIGSKESGREFLLATSETLWTPSCMYLLLPLESQEPHMISWKEIDSCVSVVEFIKRSSNLRAEKHSMDLMMLDSDSTDIVHFANKSLHKDAVKNVVVLAIHTGEIYFILELLQDETADNALLLLQQSHRAQNVLVDFNGEGVLHGKVNSDRQRYARIPPKLLVVIDARIDVVKSFYLLPSLMHRLESLMLASQLREEIAGQSTHIHISNTLILEAITTQRCNESFSMERLELLGDSVLKFAVSCDLYLEYAKKHEGQLSSRRSWQVCNSTLYNLGIACHLQGYIRDTAFDPTRWNAPGQLPLKPFPCDHGIETIQVPVDTIYQTEDPKINTGKCCDMGHRWLCSKTVSDCVEALLGAYYVGGGLSAALHCMKWLGISCELDPSRVKEAIEIASLHTHTPKLDVIQGLEKKIGYEFVVKGLLLEAITHASDQDQGADSGYCYQRLEFLGDSVLDLLITWHLYSQHKDIEPGELTDLRAASVNNENFASAAVRRNLYPHLQYRSGYLQTQISDYVKSVATSSTDTKKSPKALGDLVESIAGAILVDTKLNLDEVWRVFEPLLSPIVTPDKLELPPLHELMELCDLMGYLVNDTCRTKGDTVIVELHLQLKDELLVGVGSGNTRKVARGQAALRLLKELEKRGISKQNLGQDNMNADPNTNTKATVLDTQTSADASNVDECIMKEESTPKVKIPVIKSIDTKKGGPRSSLFELCKKKHWPLPTFTPTDHKSKSLIEVGEGVDKRTIFNRFESRISLPIPAYGDVELMGDPQADKKSSYDSAALLMLYELQRLEMIKIG